MNPPETSVVPASAVADCEKIAAKLSAAARTRNRVISGLSNFGLAIFYGWLGWKDCVTVPNSDTRAVTISGGIWLALAFVSIITALQQVWLPPKDRLLRLLAEDHLARRKVEATTPEPQP